MKDSIFCFSCGGDGWVREYVYKVFRVALCGILYICVELWLSLRRGTYRGTVTCLPVLHLIRYMLSFSCSYSSYTIPNIPGSQYLEYVDPRNVLLLL